MSRRVGAQVAITVLIVALRVGAAAWASPVVMPDSERYRNDIDPSLPFKVWDGYGPGVLPQIVHLLPLPAAITVQTALVAAIWGVASVYAATVATRRWSWPVFVVVLGWSLSPWFLIWDPWVLSESLMLAGCALAAVGIGAVRGGVSSAPWVAVAGVAIAVTARPFSGGVLLPLVGLALLLPMARARMNVAPLAATAMLGVFATWQVLTVATIASAPYSYLSQPESMTQIQATDRFAGRSRVPGYIDLAREAGMPDCPEAEALVDAGLPVGETIARLREIRSCARFEQWLADGGLPWIEEFTDNTRATLAELVRPSYWVGSTFAEYMGPDDRVRYVRQLARARWDELVALIDAVMLVATALVSIVVIALPRGHRGFYGTALAIVAAVSIYAWGADGIEYWRHVLPAFAILVPLAATLLATRRPEISAGVDLPNP